MTRSFCHGRECQQADGEATVGRVIADLAFPNEILEALLLAQIHAQRDGNDDLATEIDRRIERLRALDEDAFCAALPAALVAATAACFAGLAPRLEVTEQDVANAEALLAAGEDADADEEETGRTAARVTAGLVVRVARERGTVAAPPRRPAATILQRRATRLPRARDRAHRPTAARRRCRGSSPPDGDGRTASSGDDPPGPDPGAA